MNRKIASKVVLLAGLVGVSANAGEYLQLKIGKINPSNRTELSRWVPSALSAAEATSQENFIVQYKGVITADDRAALEQRGLKILTYIPDDAYLVTGPVRAIQGLEQVQQVQAVVPFMSSWKLSPQFPPRSIF